MNRITRLYIHDVRTLFPSKGRKERDYLKKLGNSIDEFCEETHAICKQDIYEKYGNPIDIVYDYYSALDTDTIVKKIRFSNTVKIGVVVIIFVAMAIGIIYAIAKYDKHIQMEIMANGFIEEEEPIVTGRWDENGYPLPLDNNPYGDPKETLSTEE